MLGSPSRLQQGDSLSGAGQPDRSSRIRRRDFLIRFCQGAGAALIPSRLRGLNFHDPPPAAQQTPQFLFRPHYRSERPLDATLRNVEAGLDGFALEKYAAQIGSLLDVWCARLRQSPGETQTLANLLGEGFAGSSLRPSSSRVLRSDALLEVRQHTFAPEPSLGRSDFVRELQSCLGEFQTIVTAEFQITAIDEDHTISPAGYRTRIRYEIAGTGVGFHREQRVGEWEQDWEQVSPGDLRIRGWKALHETRARSHSPIYIDTTAIAFGQNPSYTRQMLHGTDYWRTVLDGACGIDIYGHNGVSVADIDNDGLDDIYVCQPAGLPNRLYRNRGDGAFEDITDASGLGILENTACALFADFRNCGLQDAVLVRTSGPLLYENQGAGRFRLKADAFLFIRPPEGTFTGAAAADYDRDGWLDIYFCLYSYYQGTGQYKYPSPYHDAENGPPNFLMRNHHDGTFRDVTAAAGLNQNNTRYSFCCAWGDANGDGWPDLYVVNDFGRKNLYRNNGDGTFTDIAHQAGAEDVGAGMSVGWLDYDNDNAPDLYVANMWTAAGLRVARQENFKPGSSPAVRALYQKHAMGNTLLHNQNGKFDDATQSSGVGVGRWSWSSDAFDFDHDGFSDLYIANGMISGPSRQDLNSFFWRQVVANSPDDAGASKEYEQGWSAINELIRSDGTWSGYERNLFYANNRDGTFCDVSAAVGLDFVEDSRSFALADFDRDGRMEVLLKNRNAPQLRLLKNVAGALPPSIAFRLRGTKSNRDAIGAVITLETDAGRQTRMLQAGSGFLSQHSKEVVFGLGEAKGLVQAAIRWPSGLVQRLQNLPQNHTILVEEGGEAPRLEPFKSVARPRASATETSPEADMLPSNIETWLLAPIAAPDFSLAAASGEVVTLSSFRGKAVLLTLWSEDWLGAPEWVRALQQHSAGWAGRGLQPVVVVLKTTADGEPPRAYTQFRNQPYRLLLGSDDVAAVYNILYRQIFDRHRDLSGMTSFLVNPAGEIVKVYQGALDPAHVDKDFQNIPASDVERLARALPFPSAHGLDFGRNYLSLGALFFQRGYLDQAETAFQQAFREAPSSAEALYGIGSVYLNQNKNPAARDAFERAVKLTTGYPATLPDSWNNLGVIATRENRIGDAVECFQQALRADPHHLAALTNLGNAYRLLKRWEEAREALEQAVQVAPQDPEANYSLGMVFAQTGENAKAYGHLQRALQARPDYPEALNNLGVLYLVTQRRDDAVASFQQCIRAAPGFDQAYLNLARVYALEGTRDKAREVLLDLLKQHPDHAQAKQMLDQLSQ